MSDRSNMDSGGVVTGLLLGAIVGAGLALLLAPGPGDETRKKLGETARRIGGRASDMMRRAREGEADAGA
jgi:gas vesicle protein